MKTFFVAVALAAGWTLALAGATLAHVSVSPGLLETGREATLQIELPELRPGPPPTALDVFGPGIRTLESTSVGRLGEESRWRVRVRVLAEPEPLALSLRAGYEDGRSVTVRQTVTVLPASAAAESARPVLAAAAAGLALVAMLAAMIVLRRRRRRP